MKRILIVLAMAFMAASAMADQPAPSPTPAWNAEDMQPTSDEDKARFLRDIAADDPDTAIEAGQAIIDLVTDDDGGGE